VNKHAAAFAHCLMTLDVAAARRLWAHVNPHLPQPANDIEMLTTLHVARLQSKTVPRALKDYSKRWLDERKVGHLALGVGIAVGAPPHRMKRAIAIREAMEDAVESSVKAGIDIDEEADEVRHRMDIARAKEIGGS
jgi:hypothetical protein